MVTKRTIEGTVRAMRWSQHAWFKKKKGKKIPDDCYNDFQSVTHYLLLETTINVCHYASHTIMQCEYSKGKV